MIPDWKYRTPLPRTFQFDICGCKKLLFGNDVWCLARRHFKLGTCAAKNIAAVATGAAMAASPSDTKLEDALEEEGDDSADAAGGV